MTPDADDLCVFAVKRGYIESKEIYCNTLYPFYLSLVEKYKKSLYCCGKLDDFVEVNPKTDCGGLGDKDLVSFVPMPNVQEKNNVVSYDLVPYDTVKKGFTVFQKGDLIWAKITPCMQNGKSCIVDKMPTEIGFGSTEFHVVRKRSDKVYMPFVWALLSNDSVLKAAQATFSGSAGQQRVSASFIEEFPAVLPKYDLQVDLVANLESKLAMMNQKFQQAKELLYKFESKVAEQCGIQNQSLNKLCYAIRLKDLDGVIDAKRYMANQINSPYTVSDICEIVDEKISPSLFATQNINWIRIDDLPNRPLDIETIRIQPANTVEGSFFQVQNGDILVARLGPTILNQKIVMVRDVACETIASAEFLVLRCKEGYDAEAVMAVLKTPYFCNLMYSHARGSTPSRYRLNREDMLRLPFPDINDKQKEIVNEAISVRLLVKKLRADAEQEWQTARAQFERELLGD